MERASGERPRVTDVDEERPMYADHLLRPWFDCLMHELPGARVFDAHTHVGEHDTSGFTATLDELVDSVEAVDGRAVVFPLEEPDGYRRANRTCARAAAESDGRLVAFARLTPAEVSQGLLEEAMASGAAGLKLHVSSDRFHLGDPRLARAFDVADEHRLPVVVHAGPEVESLRHSVLDICRRWPRLNLILAHAAIPDLGHLWRHVPDLPNLFFDTAWWTPAHLMALFRLVPPGRILSGSDLPYATPLLGTMTVVRCAWQAGLDGDQIASVVGGQLARLVEGQEPLDVGPPPAAPSPPTGPFQEIVSTSLLSALEAMQRGDSPGTPLVVARHACDVRDGDPEEPALRSVLRLLDLHDAHHESLPQRNQFRPGWDIVATAAIVARTPAAPLPDTSSLTPSASVAGG